MSTLVSAQEARRYIDDVLGKESVPMVAEGMEGLYDEEDPPADGTFEIALQVVVHHLPYDLELDPTMSKEATQADMDRGVCSATFGGDSGNMWNIDLNWQTRWAGKIPPGYARIAFRDIDVGIIGPWATVRTCWSCGMSGFADPKAKIGRVVPEVPCPNCGQLDWWGQVIDPSMFERDAAEEMARVCGKSDHIYNLFTESRYR